MLFRSMPLSAAKQSSIGKACIVDTTSIGYELFDGIHFDTLLYSSEAQDKDVVEMARKKLGMSNLYKRSKVGIISFVRELAERYGEQGLMATSCNPCKL